MASPEQSAGRPEPSPRRESEPVPYQRAAQFEAEPSAAQAYQQLRDAIYVDPANDLSAYRVRRVTTNEIPAAGRRGTGG